MAPLKQKGDRAEIEVAHDLIRRGFRIAIPYGEDWDFDLIFQRPDSDAMERVQVKYARTIDWLAVYDSFTDRCFYIPAEELGSGRDRLHLRLRETRNGQCARIRYAEDYTDPVPSPQTAMEVEPAGLEPAASGLQSRRSSN